MIRQLTYADDFETWKSFRKISKVLVLRRAEKSNVKSDARGNRRHFIFSPERSRAQVVQQSPDILFSKVNETNFSFNFSIFSTFEKKNWLQTSVEMSRHLSKKQCSRNSFVMLELVLIHWKETKNMLKSSNMDVFQGKKRHKRTKYSIE